MESSIEGPQKLKLELPYDPAIPLLDTYPKKMKTLVQKIHAAHYSNVHSNIIYNSQDKETN